MRPKGSPRQSQFSADLVHHARSRNGKDHYVAKFIQSHCARQPHLVRSICPNTFKADAMHVHHHEFCDNEMSKMGSGNHYRSDPVQVQSTILIKRKLVGMPPSCCKQIVSNAVVRCRFHVRCARRSGKGAGIMRAYCKQIVSNVAVHRRIHVRCARRI